MKCPALIEAIPEIQVPARPVPLSEDMGISWPRRIALVKPKSAGKESI